MATEIQSHVGFDPHNFIEFVSLISKCVHLWLVSNCAKYSGYTLLVYNLQIFLSLSCLASAWSLRMLLMAAFCSFLARAACNFVFCQNVGEQIF